MTAWRISEKSSWKVDWVELDDQDEAFAGEIWIELFLEDVDPEEIKSRMHDEQYVSTVEVG